MSGLYNYRWQQRSKHFLRLNPWCAYHLEQGKHEKATVVDHKIPHRGDEVLFWDQDNWQGLCGTCHNSHKQHEEKTGHMRGCDVNGFPLDPNHHWKKGL